MGTLGTLAVSILGDSKDLDKTFDNVEKKASGMTQGIQKMGDGMFKAGVGITAVGTTMTALGKSVEPLNQSLDRTAALTGENSQELRDLALNLTDATFPLDDVTRGMERLVEAGIETAGSMEKILPVADDLSDALGKDIVDSIDLLDRTSSALGIPLEDMGEHLDTLTFLGAKTTVGTKELGQLMRREAPNMQAMGLSVEDVAVAMAALEAEGRRGPRAVMGFQAAIKDSVVDVEEFYGAISKAGFGVEEWNDIVSKAEGDVDQFWQIMQDMGVDINAFKEQIAGSGATLTDFNNAISEGVAEYDDLFIAVNDAEAAQRRFWEALGVSSETLDEQNRRLEESVGITEELADINNRSLTLWDELKQKYQEIVFEHGELIEAGGHLGQIMMGIGPIMAGAGKGISMLTKSTALQTAATKAMTIAKTVGATAIKAFGLALKIALGPIGLIILAIGALVVAGWYLYNNWEEVTEWLREVWEKFVEHIKQKVDETVQFFKDFIDFFRGLFTGDMEQALEALHSMFAAMFGERIAEVLTNFTGTVLETVNTVVQWFRELPGRVWEWLLETVNRFITWRKDMHRTAIDAARDVFSAIMDRLKALPRELLNIGRNMISNFAQGIRDRIGNVRGAIGDVAGTVRNWLPFSPAKMGPLRDIPDWRDHLVKPAEEAIKDLERLMQRGMTRVAVAMPGQAPLPAVAGAGAAQPMPAIGSGDTISNHFYIEQMNVRDDEDIEKLAEKLYELQRKRRRST